MVEIIVKSEQTQEKWYQSRRIWGALLSLGATVLLVIAPDQYEIIVPLFTLIATALGITSWVAPKK